MSKMSQQPDLQLSSLRQVCLMQALVATCPLPELSKLHSILLLLVHHHLGQELRLQSRLEQVHFTPAFLLACQLTFATMARLSQPHSLKDTAASGNQQDSLLDMPLMAGIPQKAPLLALSPSLVKACLLLALNPYGVLLIMSTLHT